MKNNIKETACLFFWDCKLDVQKHSYSEVEKMFDQWVSSSQRSAPAPPAPVSDAVEFAEWITDKDSNYDGHQFKSLYTIFLTQKQKV